METYTIRLTFQGIEVTASIKPVCGEQYELVVRSRERLSESYRKALASYLETEGYVTQAQLKFE